MNEWMDGPGRPVLPGSKFVPGRISLIGPILCHSKILKIKKKVGRWKSILTLGVFFPRQNIAIF
jgi:hypothetical protein